MGEGSTEIWLKSHGSGEIDNHSTMCICFYLDYSSHNYLQTAFKSEKNSDLGQNSNFQT